MIYSSRIETDFSRLLSQVLERARAQGIRQKELARRAGTTPETLSRVKARGRGDAELLVRLGRIVGLRLSWVPDDDLLQALEERTLF
jgi:transcriptional regulator with XRE-family HTH domain